MAARSDLTVLVMGETGSGKSSVVNLLVGQEVIKVSSGVCPCTPRTVKYEATIKGRETQMSVRIWEVGGFNQPEEKPGKNPGAALAMDLGPILQANASVNVILFCMQGSKLKLTTTRIFQSINDVFGGRVTIVLVITKLEREETMEGWWGRNGQQISSTLGLRGTVHACITGLQGGKYGAKSTESRASLLSILEGLCSSHQDSVSLESVLREDVRRNGGKNKKDYAKKRFKLDAATAKQLVTY